VTRYRNEKNVPKWLYIVFYTLTPFYLILQFYIAWTLTRDILICGLRTLHRALFIIIVWTIFLSYTLQYCLVNIVWVYRCQENKSSYQLGATVIVVTIVLIHNVVSYLAAVFVLFHIRNINKQTITLEFIMQVMISERRKNYKPLDS